VGRASRAEHPNLFFASQLPDNILCEMFLFASLNMSFRKLWIYKYGRVPFGLLVSKNLSNASMELSILRRKPGTHKQTTFFPHTHSV
jgi:hypothetical protein